MPDGQMEQVEEKLDLLLDRYAIDEGRYSIGPFFSDGVTLYKQQVRALNLIYALAKRGHIHYGLGKPSEKGPDPKVIGIIGGGVAGMTAAVAAATLGNNVHHFEQRTDLCHLQAGCETRWVHPHNYDWPRLGSDNPYAGLLLMNWQAGTAAEVARALTRQYWETQKASSQLRLHLGATTFLSQKLIKWDNCVTTDSLRTGSVSCDLVILAMGFGIERYVRRGNVDSYWRNDDLNQLRPGVTSERREVIFVSGTGDGGLVDVLRSKIFGFSPAWIIQDLFTEEEAELLEFLRSIADSKRKSLFDELSKCGDLVRIALQRVRNRLRPKVRKDVSVILNDRGQTFADALHPRRAAVLNCFLAYLLHLEGEFTYVQGDVGHFEKGSVTLTSLPQTANRVIPASNKGNLGDSIATEYSVDRVIVRHGTEREESLRLLGLDQDVIVSLRTLQQAGGRDESPLPQWEPGWWSRQPTDKQQMTKGVKEFLPPASEALAATFIQTLGETIFQEINTGETKDFRLTVHRAINIRDNIYFQQMAPYAARGSRKSDLEDGESGRIWELEVGIVGLAFRTGLPIVLTSNNTGWDQLWVNLMTNTKKFVRVQATDVKTLAAIPIFAQSSRGSTSSRTVSLVIFVDSKDDKLFEPHETSFSSSLTEIFRAARGFVRSCEYLVKKNVIRLPDHPFSGVKAMDIKDAKKAVKSFGPQAHDASKLIKGYKRGVTSQYCLHWDCIYVSNQFVHGTEALADAGPPITSNPQVSPA